MSVVLVTFLGGVFDMSIWFSDTARKSLKDKIERQRQTRLLPHLPPVSQHSL